MKTFGIFAVSLLLCVDVSVAQICNTRHPGNGGKLIPAFGHGEAKATYPDYVPESEKLDYCVVNRSSLAGAFSSILPLFFIFCP